MIIIEGKPAVPAWLSLAVKLRGRKMRVSKRINPSVFYSHIILEQKDTNKLKISLLKCDEEAIEGLINDQWNYALERREARKEVERKWYPYRDAGILEGMLIDQFESDEVKTILQRRWSELQEQVSETYWNERVCPEINRALQRRQLSEATYQTDWGFRVRSKGEQLIANALKRYILLDEKTGAHRQITLLYEPLFRIPNENRIIMPDFVIPECCLIVEYAGLEEKRNYKVGLWLKTDAIRKLGFPLVILRSDDLTALQKSFNQKLRFYFDLEASLFLD
jgi:hypothetical protein